MDYKEKVIELLKSNNVTEEQKAKLRDVFPELKESEDERIKKALKNLVENCNRSSTIDGEISKADTIAWIEKKDEQKPTAEDVLIKAGLKPYKDGDQWCVLLGDNIQEGICGFGNTIEDALYAFLKDLIASQGEQKPAEWSEYDNEMFLHCCAAIRVADYSSIDDRNIMEKWFRNLKDRVQPQPKQDWSEEDEVILSDIICSVNASDAFCGTILLSLEKHEKKISWLKSLKDRVQPKQEWSEEDENNLNSCIAKLEIDMQHWEDHGKTMVDGDKKLIEWLKSLRPQSHWKPSVFHLECIEDAISLYEKHGINAIGLKEILEQLKKLREE